MISPQRQITHTVKMGVTPVVENVPVPEMETKQTDSPADAPGHSEEVDKW